MSIKNSHKISLQEQLFEIFKQFPSIFKYEQMSICSRVYYPIAIIDTLIEETIKQPFSPLEQVVLELIKSGHQSVNQLSLIIGLPSAFLEELIKQLESDRIINNFTLTTKGEEEINQKIKLTKRMFKQSIYYDALLQEVLEKDVIQEHLLVSMQDTSNAINHFMPQPYIDPSKISVFFDEDKEVNDIVVSKEIKEIINTKICFIEVIVLQFNLIPHPFIFFPTLEGKYNRMLSISETNLSFVEEETVDMMRIDRRRYYDIWLSVKQIKDDMKRTVDNQILRRDIKSKFKHNITICNEEHTILTDSGITLVLELHRPFSFDYYNFNAIRSIEWSSQNIPFMYFEDDPEYSSFITYSECFDRRVHDASKLIFQLEQLFTDRETLYRMLCSLIANRGSNELTITELHELLSQIKNKQQFLGASL